MADETSEGSVADEAIFERVARCAVEAFGVEFEGLSAETVIQPIVISEERQHWLVATYGGSDYSFLKETVWSFVLEGEFGIEFEPEEWDDVYLDQGSTLADWADLVQRKLMEKSVEAEEPAVEEDVSEPPQHPTQRETRTVLGLLAGRIMPVYVVCDEPDLSTTIGGTDFFNESLREIHATIASQPVQDEVVRLGVIAFSDNVEVLLPLSRATEIEALPKINHGTESHFGKVFQILKDLISRDVALIQANGYDLLRPMVLFVSDGRPSDSDWHESHRELTTQPERFVNIIAFGEGKAEESTLTQVAHVWSSNEVRHPVAGSVTPPLRGRWALTPVRSVRGAQLRRRWQPDWNGPKGSTPADVANYLDIHINGIFVSY